MSPAPGLAYAVVDPSRARSPELRKQLLEMLGLLVDGGSALRRHWRTILRLMIRPELQGCGAGRLLLVGRHPAAIRLAPGDDRDELILVSRL